MKQVLKWCGWGHVDYSRYIYTGQRFKQCKCGTISEIDANNDVRYSGGVMHNACWYCGASFEE
jgi:hypothetical protein